MDLCIRKFCSHYRDFKKANRLTMHIEHKAGEEIQVDLSRLSASIHKPSKRLRKGLHMFL